MLVNHEVDNGRHLREKVRPRSVDPMKPHQVEAAPRVVVEEHGASTKAVHDRAAVCREAIPRPRVPVAVQAGHEVVDLSPRGPDADSVQIDRRRERMGEGPVERQPTEPTNTMVLLVEQPSAAATGNRKLTV